MKGGIHGDNALLSREVITFVDLLIRSISKKDTFKGFEVELETIRFRNMNLAYAIDYFRSKGKD